MATVWALRGGPRICLFCDSTVREVRCRCPRCPHTERLCNCAEVIASYKACRGRCEACVDADCAHGRPCPHAGKTSGIVPMYSLPETSQWDPPAARQTQPCLPATPPPPRPVAFGATFARSLGAGPHCARCGMLRTAAVCRCPGCTEEIPMCGCHDSLAMLVTRSGYCVQCEAEGCHDAWSCRRQAASLRVARTDHRER